jgi:hypothetical protein
LKIKSKKEKKISWQQCSVTLSHKMELFKLVTLLGFCLSLAYAETLNEDAVEPSTNYVFDLPDIVANYKSLGGEVQLEAFGASGVNIFLVLLEKSYSGTICFSVFS